MANLACAIAEEMVFSKDQIDGIRMAGAIHDIGKLYVPAEILSKPTALSDAEMAMVRGHPQVGYDILKGIEFPWRVAEIILQHHERVLGNGYPAGLKGDEILIEARMLAVDDVVEFKNQTKLNIVSVGYTIYLGSEYEANMLQEAAQTVLEAHRNGMICVLWIYPRGKAVKKESKSLKDVGGVVGIPSLGDMIRNK